MGLTVIRIADGNLRVQDNKSGQCSIFSPTQDDFIFVSPRISEEESRRAIRIFNSVQLAWSVK